MIRESDAKLKFFTFLIKEIPAGLKLLKINPTIELIINTKNIFVGSIRNFSKMIIAKG